MRFTVHLMREAREDLQRLEDFLVAMALEHGDFDLPGRAVDAHSKRDAHPRDQPLHLPAHSNPIERELIIPFGASGYLALFEIISGDEVAVSALRHQREDDHH